MLTKGRQISLFPETKQLEGQLESEVSRSVAPRWVFGRIDKKKGRRLWVLKQHPDAAIVCISHPPGAAVPCFLTRDRNLKNLTAGFPASDAGSVLQVAKSHHLLLVFSPIVTDTMFYIFDIVFR